MVPVSTELPWDAEQSARSLYNFIHLLTQKQNFSFGLRNLSNTSERFYEKALEPKYETALTSEQQLDLRNTVTRFANWLYEQDQQSTLESGKVLILQICYLKCIRYVFTKAFSQEHDAFSCINAYKLALTTAASCYDCNDYQEMNWCMKEAVFLRQQALLLPFKPVEVEASLIFCDSSLCVLRLLCQVKFSPHVSLGKSFESVYNVELCCSQAELIVRLLWNIAVENFVANKLPDAICFLKTSHNFGKRIKSYQQSGLFNKTARLMVAASLNMYNPALLYMYNLYLSGVPDKHELLFHIAVHTKNDPKVVLQLTKNLLLEIENRHKHQMDVLRGCLLKVLKILEKQSYSQIMAKILEEWLRWWPKLTNATTKANPDTGTLWIWAEISLRLCLNQKCYEGAYDMLNILAKLPFTSAVNCKSARNILALAETSVASIDSPELTYKWYKSLLRIHQHILSKGYVEQTVVDNAIRSCVSYGSPKSLEYAFNLLEQIESSYGFSSFHHVRFMLLVAILRSDKPKATEIWTGLELKYKSTDCIEDDWAEGLTVLEHCVMSALTLNGFEEIAVNCLTAISLEGKLRTWSSELVVRVVRFQLGVVFLKVNDNTQAIHKCIDNIISILISSYLNTKENSTCSSKKSCGSSDMDLYFGNLAWFLAQKVTWLHPFHRHQLFKLSYKFFSISQDRDSTIDQRIRDAIILAVVAGINSCNGSQQPLVVPYPNILQSCLEILKDFPHDERDRDKSFVLRLYEFFILCQIGNLKRIAQFIESCVDDPVYEHHFFENLSTLASSNFSKSMTSILPITELGCLARETLRNSRTVKLQRKLNVIAVACLKISIERLLKQEKKTRIQTLREVTQNWKRAFMILSEDFTLSKDIEEQLFNLFLDYIYFAKQALDNNDHCEVIEFFNFCCNTVMEIKISNSSAELSSWLQLLEDLGSLSADTQKLLRIFKREMLY